MNSTSSQPRQTFLDRITRRWWFNVLLLSLFFLPCYSAVPYNSADTSVLITQIISHPLIHQIKAWFPLFKILPLFLILWLICKPGPLVSRLFYAWAGFNLLTIGLFQNMGSTPTYGFAAITGNILLISLTGIIWLITACKPVGAELACLPSDCKKHYWLIPLALLAFWFPANTAGAVPTPDLSLTGFFVNEGGVTYCMMLPVYLTVLICASPRTEPWLLRFSAAIGFMIALFNALQFLISPSYGSWMAMLHIPLLVISARAYTLSYRLPSAAAE